MPVASPAGPDRQTTRWGIRFARRTLSVHSESTWLNERIPRLYGAHCDRLGSGSTGEPPDIACEHVVPASLVLRLGCTFGRARIFPNPQETLTPLREQVQAALVRDEAQSLMFHAAALERDGRVFLFPAASGSGKTTLAAWLVGHGYRLLSDELAAIDSAGSVSGFCQAMNVKTQGIPLVAGWPWLASAIRASLATPRGLLLPWREHTDAKAAPITHLVFPGYQPGAAFSAEPMSTARATAGLLTCLLNARNLPRGGLHAAAAVCRRVPATRLRFSRLQEVVDWLDQLATGPHAARSTLQCQSA